jgi:hypothetical protein
VKDKSKVKSQKAKVKSDSVRAVCFAYAPETLLTFAFCLLTFDLPFF